LGDAVERVFDAREEPVAETFFALVKSGRRSNLRSSMLAKVARRISS